MSEINFTPGESQSPAPFLGGVPPGGQSIPPSPGAGDKMPSPLPPIGDQSIPTPPPQPVEPSVPPPPPPEIGIRTMASDIKSMQSSGGAEATPKVFKPDDFSSEPIFRPSGAVPKSVSPVAASGAGVKVISPNHTKKALIVTLAIVVLLAVAGAAAYFYILPIFTSKPVATPAPVAQTPAPTPTPTPIPVGLTQHQSFFTSPASISVPVSLDLSLVTVQTAVSSASSDIQPAGTFKEINFTIGGKPWTTQDFLGLVLPNLAKDFLSSTFEQDFTAFIYYDKNGAWPGYVFKLKPEADTAVAKTALNPAIEESPAVFFQTSPGVPAKTAFDDGALPDGKAVRFVTFNKKGAALEYSWFGNYLTVSTSYQGLIEAVKHLGA
jgi:hypothetical protein